mmetsp:Transcript_14521/g.17667  ORF Transcript_14521/g.17667 Transcript_14521/m.17667 type:complete len:127 (+) Transcript_14521:334-714(+)
MGGHSAWRKRVKNGELAKQGGGAICRHRPHLGRKGKEMKKNRKGNILGGPNKKKKNKTNAILDGATCRDDYVEDDFHGTKNDKLKVDNKASLFRNMRFLAFNFLFSFVALIIIKKLVPLRKEVIDR